MNADWTTSPTARRVLQHAADTRPAWLWSHDGQTLLWHNPAAELFLAKLKKYGLKLASPAVPIKGQVARNIRLGSTDRSSLARIQFLAGAKPASATCVTTPLIWQDGQSVLLIVGVDPIDAAILAAGPDEGASAADDTAALPPETATADQPPVSTESSNAPEDTPASQDVAAWDGEDDHVTAEPETQDQPPALSAETRAAADDTAYARALDNWRDAEQDAEPALSAVTTPAADEPPQVDASSDVPEAEATAAPEAELPQTGSRLSQLVDRLAADEALYTPLSAADDTFAGPAAAKGEPVTELEQVGDDMRASLQAGERDASAEQNAEPGEQTEAETDLAALEALDAPVDAAAGDGPKADADADAADEAAQRLNAALAEIATPPATDPEIVERVSRYNFDELSRILNDRVGESSLPPPAPPPAPTSSPTQSGALISLSGETLVLNRLPLGILVFRDQQVLFANRAITEMVGYESVEALRQGGLAAVFPAAGPEGQEAGPVNHLVQRDGTLIPVTARLQSISWHGRPALMLSASSTEVRTGHEGAVNAFAQAVAEVRGDGFFEANRTGVVSTITARASTLLGRDGPVEGKLLANLIAAADVAVLREFLERPARFAETARPWLKLLSATGKAEISIFAQGQAGVVTGYFGFVHGRTPAPVRLAGPSDADPALLGRISRGVRRPLNTIIGFAELLRNTAPTAEAAQLQDYARDIGAAGQEIVALVDELEDYARLRDGRYLPQRASIDLTELLESCIVRIRQQARNARVIVRNGISETLPRLTADRASLEQAVLNLLASAIDQSPTGGAVVISAQREDGGGIAVHVRDSSLNAVDMAERFVVFRDGPGRDGKALAPVRSSVGLALTRSLLAVNAFSLSVDPAGEMGMLFTLKIPADLVENLPTSDVDE
ncbi:histidine kinase dimerization/phospho-acceptor domain-containing protein [Devosia sp.]|uniref:sensor histidine kinase n=1 Tax=Devosia sp. TaxID=1871048 RepID=UPI0027341C11|nr:histidine kinase dimerization/phospho-acceptor domain-containing protein [Devosia sp.]MDP2782888.1 histidine kinase dimerization/phospho-acceptor domain-containing protein [Devosia sp.]